jgi:hypothetical protein
VRLALLHPSFGTEWAGAAEPHMRELAGALSAAGHEVTVIGSRPGRTRRTHEDGFEVVRVGRLPEAPLRSRAFDGPLTHLPGLLAELTRGRFEVAHAFSPQDAFAARHGPAGVAFTCVEAPRRETLSDRRLRLAFWQAAIDPWNAVIVPGEEQREALWRWLAVEAEVAEPRDAAAHERIYSRCLERACP